MIQSISMKCLPMSTGAMVKVVKMEVVETSVIGSQDLIAVGIDSMTAEVIDVMIAAGAVVEETIANT